MHSSRETFKREAHLHDYIIILDRRKWLIITAIIMTMSAAFLYMRLKGKAPDMYQAQVKVLIEPKRPQDIVFYSSAQNISLDMITQMELIKTTPVMSAVVKKMGLTKAPEGTPEFNFAVKQLQGSINISFAEPKDRSSKTYFYSNKIIIISAISPDPVQAKEIANTVAQAYIDQDRLSRLQAGQDAIRWLTDQLAELKTKLEASETAFQRFKTREGIVTLDNKRSEELSQLSQYTANYINIKADILRIESIINKIESEKSGEINIPIALLNTATLQRLGTELSNLEAELVNKKRLGFTDKYPEVIKLKDSIKQTKQAILAELKQQRDFLKAQENSFLAQQEAKRNEALKLNAKELEYLNLEREVRTNQELYNTLLTKVKEISLVGDADLNNIRIVEPADMPMFPLKSSTKDPKVIMALAGVLGLFLGLGYAFLLERLENTIRTPDDIAQYLGLPVLGIIPRIPKAKKDRPTLVVASNPKSPSAEAYRNLRTNIIFSNNESPSKTIMITSAGPGEGKSITSANLALALAKAGKNVVIIDADLRRPMLHQVFKVNRNSGLSSVLEGEISISDAIIKTDEPNLSIIPAGKLPKDSAEILGSDKMKEVINYLKNLYDIIIFDSAPILGMSDSVILSAEADKTVMVIRANLVSRRALQMAVANLEQIGIMVYGVVLNDVNVKRDRYYHEYYRYYYSPYEDKKSKNA